MLDKLSEKVLKLIILKYDGNMAKEIHLSCSEINIGFEELNSLCLNLHNHGYISDYLYSNSQETPVRILLSHKGLHYFESKRAQNLQMFKKSILIPIIVTLLTELLVFLLKQLLPTIQQWL